VEVRLTGRTVEIFVKGERIAVHMRSSGNGKHTTAADHMPSSHRRDQSGRMSAPITPHRASNTSEHAVINAIVMTPRSRR